jgi:hypothetical protein
MTPAQKRVLEEIVANPGIRFGFAHSRNARIARVLAKHGYVIWHEQLPGGWIATQAGLEVVGRARHDHPQGARPRLFD